LDYPQYSNRYGKRQANEKISKDKLPLKLPKVKKIAHITLKLKGS